VTTLGDFLERHVGQPKAIARLLAEHRRITERIARARALLAELEASVPLCARRPARREVDPAELARVRERAIAHVRRLRVEAPWRW
jgi:hypothetical protein